MTTDATPGVPSPDVGGLAGLPEWIGRRTPGASQQARPSAVWQPPTGSPTTAAAIGTRPAPPTVAPDLVSLRGIATWYSYRRGHAAAGPELRRALGTGWRGQSVLVCHGGRCVGVVLSDWCACGGGRVVDLDVRSFAVLASPSVGVLRVTVTAAGRRPPDTSTGEQP